MENAWDSPGVLITQGSMSGPNLLGIFDAGNARNIVSTHLSIGIVLENRSPQVTLGS